MNSSLDKLVKNLLDKDFKDLAEEFGAITAKRCFSLRVYEQF